MSDHGPSLDQIQRWMQSVLMHSGGVEAGVDSPEARQQIDAGYENLESVIRPSRSLSSAARLEIYVDAYFERLMECLREDFPATWHAVGDDLFNALAFGYLQHYPSRSYTLNTLGERFAEFLSETQLHAHETPSEAGPTWPRFVIELAILERSMRDVFDGPGTEESPLSDLAKLSDVPAERWGELRLIAAPCVRLHAFDHPVAKYWAEFKKDRAPGSPQPEKTHLAISRRNYQVVRQELSELEFGLLERIVAGDTVGAALAGIADRDRSDWESFEHGLPESFTRWSAGGFFLDCELR